MAEHSKATLGGEGLYQGYWPADGGFHAELTPPGGEQALAALMARASKLPSAAATFGAPPRESRPDDDAITVEPRGAHHFSTA